MSLDQLEIIIKVGAFLMVIIGVTSLTLFIMDMVKLRRETKLEEIDIDKKNK